MVVRAPAAGLVQSYFHSAEDGMVYYAPNKVYDLALMVCFAGRKTENEQGNEECMYLSKKQRLLRRSEIIHSLVMCLSIWISFSMLPSCASSLFTTNSSEPRSPHELNERANQLANQPNEQRLTVKGGSRGMPIVACKENDT